MTNDAVIVMQLVLGMSLIVVVGVVLMVAARRMGSRGDLFVLVGFYLVSGGGLAMVGFTGLPDQSEQRVLTLGLKLGWVLAITGIAYLACLGSLRAGRHRRTLELIAERHQDGRTPISR